MDQEDTRRLIRLVESQHDKLDEHGREVREKLEENAKENRIRWDEHIAEHRNHDRAHADIGQWQVKSDERFRQGAETMQNMRKQLEQTSKALNERTRNPSIPKTVGAVLGVLGIVAISVSTVTSKANQQDVTAALETKADKIIVSKLETKAEKSDVDHLSEKLDVLSETLVHVLDQLKLQKPTPKGR